MVEHPGKMVTENLYLVQPALLRHAYTHIFILFDDCKLLRSNVNSESFDLRKILLVMDHNNLTLASPMVIGANKGGGQAFRTIMQREAVEGTEGYVSTFVEMFAWIMTVQAYQALWELLFPFVNPYGWGFDFWYNGYASLRVPGHKMGIVSTVKVKHEQDLLTAGAGRTDNNKVEDKWNAVLKQEVYFNKHFKVDLKKVRDKLDLANSSWNGAVRGYLQALPPTLLSSDKPTSASTSFYINKRRNRKDQPQ